MEINNLKNGVFGAATQLGVVTVVSPETKKETNQDIFFVVWCPSLSLEVKLHLHHLKSVTCKKNVVLN